MKFIRGKNTRLEFPQVDPLFLPGLESARRVLVLEAWDATPHLENGLEVSLRLAAAKHKVDYCHYGRYLPLVEYSRRLNLSVVDKILGYSDTPVDRGLKLALSYAKAFNSLTFVM